MELQLFKIEIGEIYYEKKNCIICNCNCNNNLTNHSMYNYVKKPFKTDVVIQNNNIKAEESITAIQNKAVPLSDIVFEISTDTGYSVEEMTLNFFETTIAFKINGEFPKEDELASFSVAQIENSTSFMSESNVPNISLTF